MKCKQCGTEFDGKFCSNCGARMETESTAVLPSAQQQIHQQPAPAVIGKQKKKKPFFLRWWFILPAIIVIGFFALRSCSGGEKIVWDDIILGDMLPEPPLKKGEIHTNASDDLWIDINDLSDKQFADYVAACEEKGFTVDVSSNSSSFDAYNAEGYKLSLRHYGSDADMSIRLEAPMEMTSIVWPVSPAGEQLPVPESTNGKFSYENDDSFFVYVGDTSKADYDEYVTACSEKGFNVDYSKGDDYYYADNAEEWHVDIRYVGNNVMSIDVDAPSEAENDSDISDPSQEPSVETPVPEIEEEVPEKDTSVDDAIDPDFKAAMDSYESFMDEYVTFMKKYAESDGTDLSILTDYAKYMSDYAEFCEDFAKWEDEEMNAAETAYYLEVQTRVNQKLLDVAY